MIRTFVDTSAWIGVAVVRDQTHTLAGAYAAQLAAEQRPLLTTNYVLSEAYTHIRYSDGHATALRFDELVEGMVSRRLLQVEWITRAIHEEALKVFRRYADNEFSVVDCSSFVVARRAKVREVFGFDEDFRTMGFVLRPST